MSLQPRSHIPQLSIFKTESPEVAAWDVLLEPVPVDVLDRIPVEVWTMVLNHVPPTRLARLCAVSRGWKTLIQELSLWKEISIACELGDPEQNVKSYKELVLGHMVIICDVCLQKSYNFGDDVPLPVRRADLLGLVWMCKQCRTSYAIAHPEVMDDPTRAPKDSDVYEQGPSKKVEHGDATDSACSDNDSNDEEWQPTWRKHNTDPDSWLNRVLCQGRFLLLQTMLKKYSLKTESNSRPCVDFISGTKYDPKKVVTTMRETAWYIKYTDSIEREVNRDKARTISGWVHKVFRRHADAAIDRYKFMKSAPPESLWPMVEFALERGPQVRENLREERDREDHERLERMAISSGIEERKEKRAERRQKRRLRREAEWRARKDKIRDAIAEEHRQETAGDSDTTREEENAESVSGESGGSEDYYGSDSEDDEEHTEDDELTDDIVWLAHQSLIYGEDDYHHDYDLDYGFYDELVESKISTELFNTFSFKVNCELGPGGE